MEVVAKAPSPKFRALRRGRLRPRLHSNASRAGSCSVALPSGKQRLLSELDFQPFSWLKFRRFLEAGLQLQLLHGTGVGRKSVCLRCVVAHVSNLRIKQTK